jgi:hypothetical protein
MPSPDDVLDPAISEFLGLLKEKGCALCEAKDFTVRNERIVHYTTNWIVDHTEINVSSNRALNYLVCKSCGVMHGLVPKRS